MITNIDENFGKLRAKLQELDLEEDTILIFMSDNGQTGVGETIEDMFTAGMRGLKGSPYDGGHRVPFMIRWPGGGLSEAAEVSDLTSYVDVMPTLLDLCGVAVNGRAFHGDSLRPLMQGETGGRWDERVVTTDTQRVAHPIKWRQSCVMKGPWRLVNHGELYDLRSDPQQETNVADEHPDILGELRAAYDEWWTQCSEGIDEDVPVSIGAEGQGEAVLRSHDLRNEDDHAVVWNQRQVRQGDVCRGWWEVDVERAGTYEFELRRWPKEARHRITGGIEAKDVEYRVDGVAPGAEGYYRGGEALSFDRATVLMNGGVRESVEIDPNDTGAVITLDLPAGPRHLRAIFSADDGRYMSAYYVYVRWLGK